MRDRNITRHERAAAVLETDGTITVIEIPPGDDIHDLKGVDRPVVDANGPLTTPGRNATCASAAVGQSVDKPPSA